MLVAQPGMIYFRPICSLCARAHDSFAVALNSDRQADRQTDNRTALV